jgi:hypothetical protein
LTDTPITLYDISDDKDLADRGASHRQCPGAAHPVTMTWRDIVPIHFDLKERYFMAPNMRKAEFNMVSSNGIKQCIQAMGHALILFSDLQNV